MMSLYCSAGNDNDDINLINGINTYKDTNGDNSKYENDGNNNNQSNNHNDNDNKR